MVVRGRPWVSPHFGVGVHSLGSVSEAMLASTTRAHRTMNERTGRAQVLSDGFHNREVTGLR